MAFQEGISKDQTVAPDADAKLETKTLLQTMDQDPELCAMADLFRKAGMDGYLSGPDLLTVFAPTKSALMRVSADSGELSSLLLRHVLGRAVTEDALRTADSVETMAHTKVAVESTGAETRIGGARIVRADVECTNGVIHMVDALLAS
jgi:uncharacterized surface protein with fasciclin (FAS1) repeats